MLSGTIGSDGRWQQDEVAVNDVPAENRLAPGEWKNPGCAGPVNDGIALNALEGIETGGGGTAVLVYSESRATFRSASSVVKENKRMRESKSRSDERPRS